MFQFQGVSKKSQLTAYRPNDNDVVTKKLTEKALRGIMTATKNNDKKTSLFVKTKQTH